MAMSPSWTGSRLREMLVGWNESQLTWLTEQIEGELTARAWLKRGQRAQPDLAPGSGPNSQMGGESLFAVAPVSTECRPKCALGGSHIDTSSFVAGHFRAMLIGIAAITRSCKRDFRRQAACARPTIGEVLLPEELGACKKKHLAAD